MVVHVSPYLRPDRGGWNGTANVLRQLGSAPGDAQHVIIACGPALDRIVLNARSTLWILPVSNVEAHGTTAEILSHASELESHLPMELRETLQARGENLEILVHGPEACLFAGAIEQAIALDCHSAVQTHFGIWDIVALAEADSGWLEFAPDLDDLRRRADECLRVIQTVQRVWIENTSMMRSLCTEAGLEPVKIEVAPLVGCPPGLEAARRLRDKRILVAGRCAYEKGFDLAIRAFDIGRRKYPLLREYSLDCIVMERRPFPYTFQSRYLQMLRELAAAVASSQATSIRPGVSHSQLMAELGKCGLLMVPSRYEPFGSIVLEGLMRGTPSVVSPHVGASESVASELLTVASDDDPEALADGLFSSASAEPGHQSLEWPTVDSILDGRHRRRVGSYT